MAGGGVRKPSHLDEAGRMGDGSVYFRDRKTPTEQEGKKSQRTQVFFFFQPGYKGEGHWARKEEKTRMKKEIQPMCPSFLSHLMDSLAGEREKKQDKTRSFRSRPSSYLLRLVPSSPASFRSSSGLPLAGCCPTDELLGQPPDAYAFFFLPFPFYFPLMPCASAQGFRGHHMHIITRPPVVYLKII